MGAETAAVLYANINILALCNLNLHDRGVLAVWSLKVSLLSKIAPKSLTKLDEIIVDIYL